ncbi:nicotinamidase-related amidase [Neisseria perflava]|uniref:hypothetical protein n=1 Tax=Neisseria perflava TaxID=33053 RepID=UPI0020A0DF76|nr:nicotinamidase-related amidase [Neisseria perflava]
MALEGAVADTARQLAHYNRDMHIIVNLSACCGYTRETTLQTIDSMKELGISVASCAAELVTLMHHFSSPALFRVL